MKPPTPSNPLHNAAVILVAAMLVFAGCDLRKSETSHPFENPYAEVGRIHNQGLDHVLADLNAVQAPVKDLEEVFDVAEASTRAFLEKRGAGEKELAQLEWGRRLIEDAPLRRSAVRSAARSNASSVTGLDLLPDSVLDALSPEQKQYVEEIDGLVESGLPVADFEEQLAELSRSALSELGEEEAKCSGKLTLIGG